MSSKRLDLTADFVDAHYECDFVGLELQARSIENYGPGYSDPHDYDLVTEIPTYYDTGYSYTMLNRTVEVSSNQILARKSSTLVAHC